MTRTEREFQGDSVELFWNRKDLETLKYVTETYCAERRVAVQAGGCLGVFADYLSRQFGRVYTFEPEPSLHRLLCANVGAPNVVVFQAALGCERGHVGMELVRRPDKPNSLHPGMSRTTKGDIAPVMQIDSLALEHCDLIYLDVEGDELSALRGAHDTIERCRPVVVCEVNAAIERHGLRRDDVDVHMRVRGYEQRESRRSDVIFTPR